MNKNNNMLKWHLFYISFCDLLAEKLCYAKRSKVGAVIVKDHNILAYGYNGTFSGAVNICEETIELEEIWKETKFKNHLISTFGKVKRLLHTRETKNKSKLGKEYFSERQFDEQILKQQTNAKGYKIVKIGKFYQKVAYLEALAFIKNPEPKFYNQINHIDFNKQNNNVTNLEWCTNRYNCEHRSAILFKRNLPVGITIDKFRKTKKYLVHIYKNGKIIGKRFESVEEAIKFKSLNSDPKDFITFKYEGNLITKPEVIHAEINAIAKAARQGISVKGATMYVLISPCIECAKLIIQSGIAKVIYKEPYRDNAGIELLTKASVDNYMLSKIM